MCVLCADFLNRTIITVSHARIIMYMVGVTGTSISEVIRDEPALVKSVSDKSLDLLRPSSRYFSIFKGSNSYFCFPNVCYYYQIVWLCCSS